MILKSIAGILSGLAAPVRNASFESPSVSPLDKNAWDRYYDGVETSAGVLLSHGNALSIGGVWQAVSTISGDVACMPMHVMLKDENGDREIDTSHHADFHLGSEWNTETPAYEGWRRMMVHALLWGNGYAYLDRRGRTSDLQGIYTLLPDRTRPARLPDGTLFYVSEVDGKEEFLYRDEVFHLKNMSYQPGCGVDWLEKARNALGLTLAAETWNSKFFANGAGTGGILMIPPTFSEKAAQNLEEGFRKRHSGPDGWFRTAVLRDGTKYQATTINAEQSQMHELRTDQKREIASFFNLPPFKLGIEDSVSYNSTEQAQRIYLQSTLIHWMTALRSEGELKLLDQNDRRSRRRNIELNPKKLLEGDLLALNQSLEIQRRNEIISANEWRQQIGMKRRTDPGGEEYRNPNTSSSNMQVPDDQSGDTGDTDDRTNDTTRQSMNRLQMSNSVLMRLEPARLTKRLTQQARSAATDSRRFCEWLDNGIAKSLSYMTEHLAGNHKAGGGATADAAALYIVGSVRSAMQPALDVGAKELESKVNEICERLESELPDAVANLMWSENHAAA